MPPGQLGDHIEIYRGGYQHWARIMLFTWHHPAVVKKEPLWDVVGNDKYVINNLLDDQYEPRPTSDILQEANGYLDQELRYSLFRGNCENFATEIRYGKAESRQVRKAGTILKCAALVLGSFVVAYYIFGSEDKEKKKKTTTK